MYSAVARLVCMVCFLPSQSVVKDGGFVHSCQSTSVLEDFFLLGVGLSLSQHLVLVFSNTLGSSVSQQSVGGGVSVQRLNCEQWKIH